MERLIGTIALSLTLVLVFEQGTTMSVYATE